MANALSTLVAKAKKAADANKGRLIFGFDATGSRAPTWALAQELQGAMFAGIKRLDVQLAVFRGDDLLDSPWESDPSALQALMSQISVEAGNTQIRRLLAHVESQHALTPVNAFVFIGDTVEEDASEIEAIAKRLGAAGVKGFWFLETSHRWNRETNEALYRRFASAMNGAYAEFNEQSAAFLAELLNAVAGFASGGLKFLETSESAGARLLLSQLKK